MAETAMPAPPSADRRNQILDAAEARARIGGYDAFSFRDIASQIGIRSASVHYHFPTKPALAAALLDRYTDRTFAALGPPEARDAPKRLVGGFRAALTEQDKMCLCGTFGAQRDHLPPELAEQVGRFFSRLVDWAEVAYGDRTLAEAAVCALEGALLLARVTGDPGVFDRTAAPFAQERRSAIQ